MLGMLKKTLSLLASSERSKLYWLVVAIIAMALVDMVGIASIFPFLSVISDPKVIETNTKLNMVYTTFGFGSKDAFLVALGFVSLILLIVSNVIRALVNISLLRFTWLKRYTISSRLLSQYLSEPYVFFLNRNSSELIAYLISEVAKVVSDVLIPFMQIFARGTMAILVLLLLFIVDPIIASVVIVAIGGGYIVIYLFAKKKLSLSGEESVIYNRKILKVLSEVFGGIKDVKLLGREKVFIKEYSHAVKELGRCYTNRFLVAQFPRYAFEVVTFGGILFIITYLIIIKGDYQNVVPLVGLYAFAAYRLMPTLQLIFQDFTSLKFGSEALDRVHRDYFNCSLEEHAKLDSKIEQLKFNDRIQFKDVSYAYPNTINNIISKFNLNIEINTTVGFVGGSGAGKTTVIDILLGLLSPNQGELNIDGLSLNEDNIRRWQKNIGYVPQHIYLADDTVKRNIAFGVPDDEIDFDAVVAAAKLANIHNFIMTELPNIYETEVGERGVRLSGGQRQRIGIARALYYNPSLLVLDEATSALDGITEDVILEAIHDLSHKKTIIIVAHRFSTVKECDVIYMLEKGKVVASGTYQNLLNTNTQFRKMAKTNEISENL